jgi:hypothetical protein
VTCSASLVRWSRGPRTLLVGGVDVFHGDALLDYINLTSRRYSVHHSSLFLGLIRIG